MPNASKPVTVQQHPDLLLPAPGHLDLGNSGKLLETGGDLSPREAAKLRQVGSSVWSHQSKRQDRRLAGVEPADQYLIDIGVGADRADGLLHIDQREVEVGVPVEHHRCHQPAGAGDLRHLANSAHGEQALLNLLAVEPLHLGRGTVARAHRDDDGGIAQVRKQVDRQLTPGQPADQANRHRTHADGDRSARGQCGNRGRRVHDASTIRTRVPSVSVSSPRTTTRSPGSTPSIA